jgi:asparagine synthase (glutamine-hydrolysing)
MCGIAGYYNYNVDEQKSSEVIRRLFHRGPDDHGSYSRGQVTLLHTRLAILELSDLGAQPYRYEDLALVYNGEIYNFAEIRTELVALGYRFDSNSDTEVVVKSFHCWRERCVDRFIGMFAFAIYEESANELFAFRDRVGVKPLYYSQSKGGFAFASELQALRTFSTESEIDLESVSLYFRFGFIPGNRSIFKHISKLEPGHYIRVKDDKISIVKYWQVNYAVNKIKTESQWVDQLEELMISAFKYRMVSDVPVGVFLSGGIDSSLLTAILQKHHRGIHTFTIGFKESGFDESPFAAKVADLLETQHTQRILVVSEARQLLSQFYSIYDEPFADTSGIPTACVTRVAKEKGMKVVLSADGGDELFGGYTHYIRAFQLLKKFELVPKSLRLFASKMSHVVVPPSLRQTLTPANLGHKISATEELMRSFSVPEFFEGVVANQTMDEIAMMIPGARSQSVGRHILASPQQQMMAWDFDNYLPDDLLVKIDRATMFHSLECREPFLDHRIVEFAATMPIEMKIRNGVGKYALRKILERYLPPSAFNRPKRGFSIPIFAWFKDDLDRMFEKYFTEERLRTIPFFEPKAIRAEYKNYLLYKSRNKEHNIEKMWRILSFMLWWEKHMK